MHQLFARLVRTPIVETSAFIMKDDAAVIQDVTMHRESGSESEPAKSSRMAWTNKTNRGLSKSEHFIGK